MCSSVLILTLWYMDEILLSLYLEIKSILYDYFVRICVFINDFSSRNHFLISANQSYREFLFFLLGNNVWSLAISQSRLMIITKNLLFFDLSVRLHDITVFIHGFINKLRNHIFK